MALFRRDGEERVQELLAEAEVSRMKGDGKKNRKLLEEVIGIYTKAQNYTAAAEIAERLKDHARAARYWFRGGDFKRAAKEHLAAHEHQAAIELFERCGEHLKAAEVLEEEGDLLRASIQYEKSGDELRAADILWAALARHAIAIPASEVPEACRRAGDLYSKLGRDEQAIEAYLRAGLTAPAARALERSGRTEDAIALLSDAGDLLTAAEIARSAGFSERASALLALRAENAGRMSEAAAHYEQAGQFAKAAMLYEFGGNLQQAAEAHERAGNLETAASLYQRVGDVVGADRCLRAMGRHQEADDVSWDPDTSSAREIYYEGDYLKAAEGFIHAARNGKRHCYEEAMTCLEMIDPGQPSFFKARTMLAEIMAEQGDKPGAIEMLRRLVERIQPSSLHCAMLYQYARLLESEGFFAEAREVYRTVVVLNPRYADVTERMRFIAERNVPSEPKFRTVMGVPASGSREKDEADSLYDEDTEEIDNDVLAASSAGWDSNELVALALPKSLDGVVLRKRFRIERQLGGGGQARVFLARDTVLDRPVAIKVLHESVAASEQGLEKFLREARLAARIHHPGCVAIFDFGHEHGLTFIAMEYIEGSSLGEVLRDGPLDPFRALQVAKEVADALSAAHTAGVIHRDVKPENILLDEFDRVRLTDFGVARAIGGGDHSNELFTGTPKYMSPEQANGDNLDSRTDIYSLGAVLYEMLSGRAPFDGSLASVAVRLTQPAPDLSAQLGLPESVRKVVKRCLERRREDRPSSIGSLLRELDNAIADVTRSAMSRSTL
jgi:eukaryotic-like serine/threonine-protein kinase